MDTAFAADETRWPVILLSHAFGGTARIMGWFGIAMARDGYIVVAVDHPGKIRIPQANTHSQAIATTQKFFGRTLKNQP